ncbi:MAG: hypothetical protein E7463_04560 [Ruminococcaceae bacterium]|nr:hypothetical protein [Oscillospiraceae bacterium]
MAEKKCGCCGNKVGIWVWFFLAASQVIVFIGRLAEYLTDPYGLKVIVPFAVFHGCAAAVFAAVGLVMLYRRRRQEKEKAVDADV